MIYPIRTYGDPILRRTATPVTVFDDDLARLASDMIETMYAADGVGLAAPQIGIGWRLFVAAEVAPRDDEGPAGQALEHQDDGAGHELSQVEKRSAWGVVREHVIVNPVVVRTAGTQHGRDGCLSLPGLSVEDVPRAFSVVLDYQDLSGARHRLGAEGYFAHVLQHEYDHLEGVLFFDHLPPLRRDRFLEEHRAQLAQWQRDAKARLKSRPEGRQRQRAG